MGEWVGGWVDVFRSELLVSVLDLREGRSVNEGSEGRVSEAMSVNK